MPKHGVPHNPNALTERIGAVIVDLPDEFRCADVLSRLPDVSHHAVRDILSKKVRQGILVRTGYGRFRRTGRRFTRYLPSALVAEALWIVLFTDPRRIPRTAHDIAGDVETLVGRPNASLLRRVYNTLGTWSKRGCVERSQHRRPSLWRLSDHTTERPLTTIP